MTEQYVILGPHRSGTSVTSAMLNAMGVNMGDNMLGPAHGNPYGHFECIEFLELNRDILAAAGGDWHHIPSRDAILAVEDQFEERIRLLIKHYDERNEQWGWKDPRTCLTIPLFHKHLSNPTYIVTKRDPDEIAFSLYERHEPVYEFQPDHWYLDHWAVLTHEYGKRIADFLDNKESVSVSFDAVMDRRRCHREVNKLADLIGARPKSVRRAFNQIRFKR